MRVLVVASLLLIAQGAFAYHFSITTGYANSGRPKTGEGLVEGELFDAGGGFTAGVRVEIEQPHFYWGPSFLFWNNVTGSPNAGERANYFQIEMGGRASYRTATVPDIYTGVGLGYTVSHGAYHTGLYAANETLEFDGDFPTASAHLGFRNDAKSNGVGVMGELYYHWGLDEPTGFRSIGPARAFLVQIGVFFDSSAQIDR
ncbi:hypothetical protein IT157_03805 [bacterium]|nr:hypothetical protein [bacterium]